MMKSNLFGREHCAASQVFDEWNPFFACERGKLVQSLAIRRSRS